ncbi:hypothetical protein Ahia01_000514600 [Argonauta hians]
MNKTASQEEVGAAGMQLFVLMYNGKQEDSLTTLIFASYSTLAALSKLRSPEKLPPSMRAAWFHSLRVYLEVLQWQTLTECVADPLKWGWEMNANKLAPIMTDQLRKLHHFSL